MYLTDFTRGAASAERARRRIRYRGATPKGDKLWTPTEDDVCRKYGSDYAVLRQKLPNRSYIALRSRCQTLGLRPKRRILTANEVSRIRRLVSTASSDQLREAFPDLSIAQIRAASRYYGIRRKRLPLKGTGISVIDSIRQRCFELRYSMVDLDEVANTKEYFQKARWHTQGLKHSAIGRAVAALDGELTIRWRDELR